MISSSKAKLLAFVILPLLSLVTIAGAAMTGSSAITLDSVLGINGHDMQTDIFWKIRLPRVCISFFAGAALAISGMAFQALFRNPLATPFTLGVSSGASLGAAVYVWSGLSLGFMGFTGLPVAAFLGAMLAMSLVYGLTKIKQNFSTATMLLAGVAVSLFFSSLILFIQYMSDFTHSFRITRWLMGGLDVNGFDSLFDILPFILVGCTILLSMGRELNLLMTGEELAVSRGVEVEKVKKILFFANLLMVGAVVSVCGPIGFVGMMAPHICRLVVGADHRILAPATMLFGGIFLTFCDSLARTLIAPAEMPVGIITALLGVPFFMWLLTRKRSITI